MPVGNKAGRRASGRFERIHKLFRLAALFAALQAAPAFLPGCGAGIPSDVGVTPGGAQDIEQARREIMTGGIPDPDAITVEGFLSEHSIDIEAPENAGRVYATGRTAWNLDFDEFAPLVTVAVGFGTNIDAATFHRDPLNLCLVIDRSGSMDDYIDQRTRTTKMTAVKVAIDRLLGKLTANDRISIVTFAYSARTDLEVAAGNDVAAIRDALDGLTPEGSTNLRRGMSAGYEVISRHTGTARSDRIIVFTDAKPTVGASSSDDFLPLMETWANRGIGTTMFGVGVDFGDELAYDISQVRGGNYFFLGDYDRIVGVFDEDFDYLVTPVAYDVTLKLDVDPAFDVDSVYGLPEPDVLSNHQQLVVPTLFLSSRQGGGAILLRLRVSSLVDFESPIEIGMIALSYADKAGTIFDQDDINLSLPAELSPSAAVSYFEDDATQRAVLLLNTALALQRACDDVNGAYFYYYPSNSDCARAVERLAEFLPYFYDLAAGLEDRTSDTSRRLSGERDLIDRLLTNIENRCGIERALAETAAAEL